MADLLGLVVEWCEAQAAFDRETINGGANLYRTSHRLYRSGRALYQEVGIDPAGGRYFLNPWFENPPDYIKELIDDPS
jgi:hypothetical protein